MNDIFCTFNEKGELEKLPDHVIEMYFESEAEMETFGRFVNSGKLAEAFKAWKEAAHV